ncbi:hypothetical protein TNCT_11141 [Trichonephila clavata]|uniref:Uncharacterized protein n=1 Tax=Trichonephila clavata TaxID=2740835 RepID=A0A8X6LVT1_TRICU|nr:hypothetical protein TNCT_11141 [Trichonephila clavata]
MKDTTKEHLFRQVLAELVAGRSSIPNCTDEEEDAMSNEIVSKNANSNNYRENSFEQHVCITLGFPKVYKWSLHGLKVIYVSQFKFDYLSFISNLFPKTGFKWDCCADNTPVQWLKQHEGISDSAMLSVSKSSCVHLLIQQICCTDSNLPVYDSPLSYKFQLHLTIKSKKIDT